MVVNAVGCEESRPRRCDVLDSTRKKQGFELGARSLARAMTGAGLAGERGLGGRGGVEVGVSDSVEADRLKQPRPLGQRAGVVSLARAL